MYKVTTKNKNFTIRQLTSKKPIVQVNYNSVWSSNAEFNLGNDSYEIKANNQWQTKFDVFKNKIDIGDIDYNWKGEIIIRLKNKHSLTKHFILKPTSIWTKKFEMKDFTSNLLWTINPEFEWLKMRYSFLVTRENGFDENKNEYLFEDDQNFILLENHVNEIELLTCTIYACLLYLMVMSGAAAS